MTAAERPDPAYRNAGDPGQRRTVTNRAPDQGRGMSLADLVQFTKDCVAAGLSQQTVPRVTSTFTGRITALRAIDGQR